MRSDETNSGLWCVWAQPKGYGGPLDREMIEQTFDLKLLSGATTKQYFGISSAASLSPPRVYRCLRRQLPWLPVECSLLRHIQAMREEVSVSLLHLSAKHSRHAPQPPDSEPLLPSRLHLEYFVEH